MTTVIFDLDGTLLNTLDDLHSSVSYALSESGLPAIDKMNTRRYLGNGVRSLIEKCVAHVAPEADKSKVDETFALFKTYYVNHSMDSTSPYPGIDQMLKECKKQGLATAIVSNKLDEAVQDLYNRFFCQSVDIALGETSGMRRKPAPDMVDEAIRRLSALRGKEISKSECVYVGDSEVDLMTARNAELKCVAVSWGFRDKEWLLECGAECVIDNPADLLDRL